MRLNLGVLDIPYNDEPGRNAPSITTGDVAEILEHKYHLIDTFVAVHEDDIRQAIEDGITDFFDLVARGNFAPDPLAPSTSTIEAKFREFLSSGEAERVGIPGTPTKAALAGVNHRLKHPYAKDNPRRPSFIDTGLFETSFRAWIDQ